jgi:hypothetical protein
MSWNVKNNVILCNIKKCSEFYPWLDKLSEYYGLENVIINGKKAQITTSNPFKNEDLLRFYNELHKVS